MKKPLSEEAVMHVRSSFTLPKPVRDQITDEEIRLLAQALWEWKVYTRSLGLRVASVRAGESPRVVPPEVRDCHEKFLCWTIGEIGKGHQVVAIAVDDNNRTKESPLQDWLNYFAPTPATA